MGDVVLCDNYYGRVRAISRWHWAQTQIDRPSGAANVLGLSGVPDAGARFRGYDEREACAAKLAEE